MQRLFRRSEQDSDEDKEGDELDLKRAGKNPTRTRKLSFAPQKIIDYKPKFRPLSDTK